VSDNVFARRGRSRYVEPRQTTEDAKIVAHLNDAQIHAVRVWLDSSDNTFGPASHEVTDSQIRAAVAAVGLDSGKTISLSAVAESLRHPAEHHSMVWLYTHDKPVTAVLLQEAIAPLGLSAHEFDQSLMLVGRGNVVQRSASAADDPVACQVPSDLVVRWTGARQAAIAALREYALAEHELHECVSASRPQQDIHR
jgi:hypothetical protein